MTTKRGTMHEKNALFLRTRVGTAKNDEGEYEMDLNVGITPMVTSVKTGKSWHLGWQEIVAMAVEAGIDK